MKFVVSLLNRLNNFFFSDILWSTATGAPGSNIYNHFFVVNKWIVDANKSNRQQQPTTTKSKKWAEKAVTRTVESSEIGSLSSWTSETPAAQLLSTFDWMIYAKYWHLLTTWIGNSVVSLPPNKSENGIVCFTDAFYCSLYFRSPISLLMTDLIELNVRDLQSAIIQSLSDIFRSDIRSQEESSFESFLKVLKIFCRLF